MACDVNDIANKIILQTDAEKGDIISNLKLQKLLYYTQGYHLAFFDTVLFNNNLEAWMYGPVVPEVYHRFKDNRGYGITLDPKQVEEIELEPDVENMFNQVIQEYGKFNAVKLMDMTHMEPPWKEAFEKPDKTIDIGVMKTFFKTLIYE